MHAVLIVLLTMMGPASSNQAGGAKDPATADNACTSEGPRFDRALGCMLGMVIGDSLGSQVEFETAEGIRAAYPAGVRDLAVSKVWQTLAGQPTDDSELALTLARSLVRMGCLLV